MLYSYEQEMDLHMGQMGHMSTYQSGDMASCQCHSDFRTSNMLYVNQI